MYLVLHQLLAKKILDTYIGLKKLNNTFRLAFLDGVLSCDKWY